jgi:hypothetical protein
MKQFYYCNDCNDFYEENSIQFSSIEVYLSNVFINVPVRNCPIGHPRLINTNEIIYLDEKPIKYDNSSILCFDIKDFSKNSQMVQFNNSSILFACFNELLMKNYTDVLFKGMGDGFICVFPNSDVLCSIRFVEDLVAKYLKQVNLFKYRIGINYGLVFKYLDINRKTDFFGQSVIEVTRIADFGDNNNILLSEKAYKNLVSLQGNNNLEEVGYCFDKHRFKYKIFNYRNEKVGNIF